jgi:hypothetical protein
MNPRLLNVCWPVAAAIFALAAGANHAQQNPLGHAQNFTSESYFEPPHEQQVKVRLSGAEASPLPGGKLEVRELKVESFSADGKPELVVRAPQCIYSPLDGVASSSGKLELQSGDGKFRVWGEGFLWRQNESSLTISNKVRTVINLPPGSGFAL